MIHFRCHGCGQKLRAPEGKAGSAAVCGKCRRKVLVPNDRALADAADQGEQSFWQEVSIVEPAEPSPIAAQPIEPVLIVGPQNAWQPAASTPLIKVRRSLFERLPQKPLALGMFAGTVLALILGAALIWFRNRSEPIDPVVVTEGRKFARSICGRFVVLRYFRPDAPIFVDDEEMERWAKTEGQTIFYLHGQIDIDRRPGGPARVPWSILLFHRAAERRWTFDALRVDGEMFSQSEDRRYESDRVREARQAASDRTAEELKALRAD